MKRIHLREIRKQYPDKPDNCHRCQLFLNGEYRSGSACMDAMDSKVMTVYDTPDQVEGTGCSAIQCPIKEEQLTKTGKIPSTYIQLCSEFVKEDIQAINPDMLATYGEAAKESVKHLGISKKIDTCNLLTAKGVPNKSAYNRVRYYKENHKFLTPEPVDIGRIMQSIDDYPNPQFGLDFEWKPNGGEVGMIPHTIGISIEVNSKYFYAHAPVTHEVRNWLRKTVGRREVTIVAHDAARAEIQRLFDMGLHPRDIRCKWECSMVTTWELMDRAGDVSLKGLGYKHLPVENYWRDIDLDSFDH